MYLIRAPLWMRILYQKGRWKMPSMQPPSVYITFDDGPHPTITPQVLELLRTHRAKATFFCIGKNVSENASVYQDILAQGHAIGNHTQHHLNGWKTNAQDYIADVQKAALEINSRLFRPPYGRIKPSQARQLNKLGYNLVFWSLLSGDFDINITPEECCNNVITHLKPGDIVVFHDSQKAAPRMLYALPQVLKYCMEKGWEMRSLDVLKIH
jgi:peptidoglycan/xylan/chitin deacetylase (PgdA/CDA1 family)